MFQIGSVIVCLIKEFFYYNLNVLKTWLDPDPTTQNHTYVEGFGSPFMV